MYQLILKRVVVYVYSKLPVLTSSVDVYMFVFMFMYLYRLSHVQFTLDDHVLDKGSTSLADEITRSLDESRGASDVFVEQIKGAGSKVLCNETCVFFVECDF